MPPNGKPYALNLCKNVIYTHTAQGCGGNPNMVYTYDLATDKVGSWGPAGGGMWGRTGPAISSKRRDVHGHGRRAVESGERRLRQRHHRREAGPGRRKPASWWITTARPTPNGSGSATSICRSRPAIFKYKGKELMVDAGKECVVYLMDTESIGGDDHRTPLYRTPLICNEEVNFASAGIWGSMATWEDAKGTRWVLTPFWGPKHSKFKAPIENGPVKYGAIAAFKVEEKAGKWTLAPAWISRDMNRAEPPVIANGVVFAYGNGEDTDQATLRHRAGLQQQPSIASKARRTPCSMRSTRRPAKSCGRAAIKSPRGAIGAGFRSPTGGSTSTRSMGCSTASALRTRASNRHHRPTPTLGPSTLAAS